MTERRIWTPEEDKVLKYLKEVLKVQKWSEISRRLQDEFHLPERNGKQCRERYTNHLCDSIKFAEISTEEEQKLFKLHDLLGNKWSQICKDFQGRMQNQIKNHFHSKLRKAIRKLNKQTKFYFKNKIQLYKSSVVYKIVEASDFRFFNAIYFQQDLKFFNDLKNLLIEYADGVISQKSQIQKLNGKEKVHFLLSQLERFQNNLKNNKKLFAINKKNKKKLNRKLCSNDNMSDQTVNCHISESHDEVESQEKEIKQFQQKDPNFFQMGFRLNQENFEPKDCLKEIEQSHSGQLIMEGKQMKEKHVESKQDEGTSGVQNQKNQMSEQKPVLKITDLSKDIIEEEEISEIPIHREFSICSFESLIEFEDNHLNDFQISLMIQRFNSFSHIDSTLFE